MKQSSNYADLLETDVDAAWAFTRYEQIRPRLPTASFNTEPRACPDLEPLIDDFDAFVFDSFGVLNVGDTPIPGAQGRIEDLRQAGKTVIVLTNGATTPLRQLQNKYRSLGFEFAPDEIISSRGILANALQGRADSSKWGIVAPAAAEVAELPFDAALVPETGDDLDRFDGFVLLSSQTMNAMTANRLASAMERRQRPLLVGNPDLVAPREDGFSLEPGHYAHDLADRLDIVPEFFGKPFGNAFEEVRNRLPEGIDPRRTAMIGDTLHTDILGGAAAGFQTILVTGHGVMTGMDVPACIETSGIVPDFVVASI